MPTSFENEQASNNSREVALARLMSGSRAVIRFVFNRPMLEKVRQAEAFEKQAQECVEYDVGGRGRALLAAGKTYIEGSRFDTGQKTLESALPPLRENALRRTPDSYESLIDALDSLTSVYTRRGFMNRAELAQAEAAIVTAQMEELYSPRETYIRPTRR